MLFSVFSSFFISVVLILNNVRKVCGQASDTCDWVGSGLLQNETRGVQPLYLRCTQGRIKWHYPRGALRALLRPPLSSFRGCVRISGNSTGARLFLEGKGRLHPLYKGSRDRRSEDLHRCFTSRGGQVALYVEADPPLDILRKDTIEFKYDLVAQENLADDMEECRPCSDDEILQSYCTSDFAIQGTVSALNHNPSTQTSELSIRVTSYKTSVPHRTDPKKYVTLHRPLKCGTKAGEGQFLFLGRWVLGRAAVRCAPRLSHWKEIRRKAIEAGTNLCQLS